MKVKSILLGLVGLAALGGGIALSYYAGQGETEASGPPPPPVVAISRPEPLDRRPALVTTGFVRAADPLAVTAEVSGRVAQVHGAFELGQPVPARQPVVMLDKARFEAERMRAESALSSAKVSRMEAQNDLDRQQQLAEDDFAAQTTLEQLEAAVAGAEAEIASAEASLQVAEERMADTEISVPFDAVVVAVDVSPGTVVQPGQVLGRVVRADRAELTTAITEADFRRFGTADSLLGTKAMLSVPRDEATRTAEIFAVSPALEDRTRLVSLKARVDDPFTGETPLVLNQLVDVEIPLPEPSGTLFAISNDALLPGQELWVVRDDDTLVPVPFTIERRTGTRLVVRSDVLSSDSRLLLTPLQTLAEGVAVRVQTQGGED